MSDEPQRPADDDREAWRPYWTALGMPWRAEPEVDAKRQAYLAERRAVKADIERGIYSFRDEQGPIRLTRADVEWLLATHESGGMRGPVVWQDEAGIRVDMPRWGLDVRGANLSGADLHELPLARIRGGLDYSERLAAHPFKTELAAVHLEGADISQAHFEWACLSRAHLEGAALRGTRLSGADLFHARLDGATLSDAHLDGADLRFAFFDRATYLRDVILTADDTGACWLAGIRWGDADLQLVNWSQLRELREEQKSRWSLDSTGKPKAEIARLGEYQLAVRANRKLAVVLRDQGINEDADRFAYRAQVLQRQVFRRQRKQGRVVGSWLLDAVSGYGYRPVRSLFTYLAVVLAFAVTYFFVAAQVGVVMPPLAALVFSVTSFHGRGFMPGENVLLTNPLTVLAACEAIIGLLIEITFIATFTQRFFAR